MTTQEIMNECMNEVNNLIENASFRQMVTEIAYKMGITAEEWNNDAKLRVSMYGQCATQCLRLKQTI